jgi:putative polysaccharide biosynthesis protein
LPLLLGVRIVVAGLLYLGIMKLANVDVFNEMVAFVRRKKM